jgi:ABC-type branched-chain amino acid transport system, permease component
MKIGKKLKILVASILVYLIFILLIKMDVIDNYTERVIISIGINVIIALSLNLIVGITGQLSMGHAAFMSIGAYISAVCSVTLGAPLIISLITGCMVAGLFAAMIGYPVLRLKGGYFSMCTLGFGEIVKVILQNIDAVGGARGYTGIPSSVNFTFLFFAVIVVFIVVRNIVNSSFGRTLKSVKNDEIATEAMGNNAHNYKVLGFVIGSMLVALAGGLYAHYITYIEPSMFNYSKSTEFLTYIVLGGIGSNSGAILGATILTLIPEFLRGISSDLNEQRMLIYGIVVIVMMIFRPQGILGTREITIKGCISFIKNIPAKVKSIHFTGKKNSERG